MRKNWKGINVVQIDGKGENSKKGMIYRLMKWEKEEEGAGKERGRMKGRKGKKMVKEKEGNENGREEKKNKREGKEQ